MNMTASHLSLRLTNQDAVLIERLQIQTGMSKSALVKQALRALASNEDFAESAAPNLFSLGEGVFGKRGDASRQSNMVKAVVRSRLEAKRKP